MHKTVLVLTLIPHCLAPLVAAGFPDDCNVVWTTPGKDAADSMPLGNGSLGINLWVEGNGDLVFHAGRNDSFSEISQLCKTGGVRVSISPNPFAAGLPFRQELKLRDGVCEITAGKAESLVSLKVFVDADHPVVHVVGESTQPVTVTARVDSWRTEPQKVSPESTWTLSGSPEAIIQSADVFPAATADSVRWYHRNETAKAFEETIRIQSLEPIRGTMRDPLLHRTFGGWLTGNGFKPVDNRTLATPSPVRTFALRMASPCEQTPTAEAWLSLAEKTDGQSSDSAAALDRTRQWWRAFWDRSWVSCDAGPSVEVPENKHPIRIGIDASGGSRFNGTIGAVEVTGKPLTGQEAAALASSEPKTGTPAEIKAPDFSGGLTIAAWIKPAENPFGRIVDKISVGGSDGFLLDSPDGGRLRLIIGSAIIQTPVNMLKPGAWQHVAATYDPKSGAMTVFLNGKPVAGPTGPSDGTGASLMTVGKAHTLQRYMQACAGRGIYPIKFNGSIFTVEPSKLGKEGNPDWRRWGDCHWWQNVRMPYHAMQAAGDFEMMMPLFDMFERIRPFAEARAKLYHQVDGCYFAETMNVWGTYANRDYGWNRNGKQPKDVDCMYWRYAWNQGLELVGLMLDYHDHTGDDAFLKNRLLPMAESVLKYFDTRFKKDSAGRIVIDPDQAVETYWHGVINDTPCVAGLNDITRRLCAFPDASMTGEQKRFFTRMKAAAPPVPIENAKLDGKPVRRIAVAEKYNPQRSNCENPELFPIWPFRIFGIDRPMIEEARNAYQLRGSHNDVGWGYDSNAAALLGLTSEAKRILKVKIANSNAAYRWPATWGPNFDWLPDHCHGGNLMATTNYMLLQHSGEKILLLPAWPKDWDVSFKLHAPRRTTVEATVRGGKLVNLKVEPESRRKDVVVNPDFR